MDTVHVYMLGVVLARSCLGRVCGYVQTVTAVLPATDPPLALPPHVVLYDGVCGFCSASIQYILRRDPTGEFHFAPLQGETAAALRLAHPQIPSDIDTVVLVEGSQVYLRSDAAFRIAARLPGPVSWLRWFRVLPRFLTDLGYTIVASARYRIWGKLEACPLPSKEQRARFLP